MPCSNRLHPSDYASSHPSSSRLERMPGYGICQNRRTSPSRLSPEGASPMRWILSPRPPCASARRRPVAGSRSPARFRPDLVRLDQRIVPSVITVTSTADSGSGSLRDALAAASNGDTIQFDSSLLGATVDLTSGELVVDKSVDIEGPARNGVIVERDTSDPSTPAFRIFTVTTGVSATISGLVIRNGIVPGWQGYG